MSPLRKKQAYVRKPQMPHLQYQFTKHKMSKPHIGREPVSPGADAKISISDTETWEKNKRYTQYKVVVSSLGKTWHIFRRYNEFNNLSEKLKKKFPYANLKLPGKKFFGNLDPNFIKHRREGLHDFVQVLVSNDEICRHPDVQAFLNLSLPGDIIGDDEDDPEQNEQIRPTGENDITVNLGPSEIAQGKPSDFEFLKVIGKGSFGKVLLAKRKEDGKVYAVKVLNKAHIMKKNEAKHIMSERNVLVKNVIHPFLVGLHYSFQTPDKLYFVLDYVNGGEMFFHLQRERCFTESRARFYSAEMASALGYLHSLNIIYRDLKPENILLDSQGHIVLTDFGLCKEGIKGRETTSTFCGTPEYLAPEVLKKQPYNKTVDWWCLGAVLYEMMFGLPPFYSKDTAEMYENILRKPLRFRSNNGSVQARNILEALLQKEKEDRLGAVDDFKEIQSHPFFSSVNWKHLYEKRIKPPYNPNVSGHMDLKHFDPQFVREPVPGSVGKSVEAKAISASVQDPDCVFKGFSYVPPDEDGFGNL